MVWAFSSPMQPLLISMRLRFRCIRTIRNFMRSFCNLYSLNPFNIKGKLKENKLKGSRLLRKRDNMLKDRKEKLQKKSNKWLKMRRLKLKSNKKLLWQYKPLKFKPILRYKKYKLKNQQKRAKRFKIFSTMPLETTSMATISICSSNNLVQYSDLFSRKIMTIKKSSLGTCWQWKP